MEHMEDMDRPMEGPTHEMTDDLMTERTGKLNDVMKLVLSHAPKILSARESWPLGCLIAPSHNGSNVRGTSIVRQELFERCRSALLENLVALCLPLLC